MQNMQKQTRKHTSTYNPLWWVVGFGVLFVLICGVFWLMSKHPDIQNPVGVHETKQLILNDDDVSLSDEDLSLAYNPHSIILSNTTYEHASRLALMLNANLSYEGKLNFGILTLPGSITIDQVLLDETYQEYWSEFEYDYYTYVSDATIGWPTSEMTDEYYYFQNAYQFLNLQNAWDYTKGEGVTVAIIDTGIDIRSNQFENISTLSYNASTEQAVADTDWNVIMDENGHGSIVAYVMAAADDDRGGVGIAPDVNLLIIKANCHDNGSFIATSDLVRGIRYAVDNGADIINMSFSSGGNSFAMALQYAADNGVICVGASGNDATNAPMYPAADQNCVSVGAFCNESFDLSSYSNFGHNDICAPGTVYVETLTGGYDSLDGTSFASPMVAGAMALYLSLNPTASPQEVVDRLLNSAADVGDIGFDYYFGAGALDVYTFLFAEAISVTYHYCLPDMDDASVVGIKNRPMWTLETPSASGYVFGGWYEDEQYTTRINLYTTTFSSDKNLYAKWGTESEVVPYTYVILSDNAVEIRKYIGTSSATLVPLTLPTLIDGKNVVSIAAGALDNRGTIMIYLPEYLQRLDRYFLGNSQLVLYEDSINNVSYISSVNNSKLCLYSCNTTNNVFVVPSATRIIFANAFVGAGGIRAIDFSQSSVVSIGDRACYGLQNLLSVNLPNGLLYLGKEAFYNCISLSLTTLPTGVSRIETFTFYNCTSITSFIIPANITSLGEAAFAMCSNMTAVSVPNTISHIPQSAFYKCSRIGAVNLSSVTRIDAYAFAGCSTLKIGTLNSYLCHLGAYAFNATKTEQLVLPNAVSIVPIGLCYSDSYMHTLGFQGNIKAIGKNAFAYCLSLTTVSIPPTANVLQEGIFKGCTNLRTATFLSPYGNGVGDKISLTIPDSMFEDCIQMVRVTVPVADISIGANAFSECGELLGITNISEITYLGEKAFYNCEKLAGQLYMAEDCDEVPDYCFYNCVSLTEMNLSPYTQFFGEYALYNCNALTNVFDLQSEVYEVGKMAFYHCPALHEIELSSDIGNFESAFRGATGLYEIDVPDSVTVISGQAFDGCTSLEIISISSNIEYIGQYAFNNCTAITEIYIPNSISLQMHAFNGCTSLEALELPLQGRTLISYFDGNHVPNSLTEVRINDATDIAASAFKDCTHLVTVLLDDDIQSIGMQAFYGCYSLRDITLPAGLNHVGRNAFYNVNEDAFSTYGNTYYLGTSGNPFYLAVGSVNTFAISDILNPNTKLLGEYSFSSWTNLSSLKLPRGLLYINENAFSGCSNMELQIPCGFSDALLASISGIEYVYYHNFSTTVIDPTMDDEGYSFHECQYCTYTYSSDYIPALRRQPMRLVDSENITSPKLMNIARLGDEGNADSFFMYISVGATLAELRQCLRVPSVPVAEDANGNLIVNESQPLKTGTTLTVYDDDNSIIDRVTIVVKGDVNGDGAISITDMLMVKALLLHKSELLGAYAMAADVNADEGISITDFLIFKSHLLHKSVIE